MEAQYQLYKDQGYVAMTMLIEGGDVHFSGDPPTHQVLLDWIERHGINHKVLADPDWTVNQWFWGEDPYPVPRTMLLKPGMEIVFVDGTLPSNGLIEANLP